VGSLQRLFTTFANGWPGCGLLVQRLVAGIALLHDAGVLFRGQHLTAATSPQAIGAVLAIFVMIGLWTPLAGALVAAVEVWAGLAYQGDAGMTILIATFGATLAMIGPGAFSVDAQLFGRKQIRR